MFTWLSYFGIVAAFILMMLRVAQLGVEALKQGYFWIVVTMLVLILAGQFGIQPILAQLKSQAGAVDVMQSVFADRFRHWHGIASIAYLFECLLGVALVIKVRL
jgi:predicted cobalt transporter CbtA